MVAAIVFCANPRRVLRLPDNSVKVDDAVVGATLADPLVDRLTHLLFLRTVKRLQRRPGEGILKGRQGGADNFDPMQVGPIDQLRYPAMIFSTVTGSSGGVRKVPGHPISLMPSMMTR